MQIMTPRPRVCQLSACCFLPLQRPSCHSPPTRCHPSLSSAPPSTSPPTMAEKWHLGSTKVNPLSGQESSFRTSLRAIKAQLFISKTIKDFDKLYPPYEQYSVEEVIEGIEEHAMIHRDASWKSEALRHLYAFVVRIAIGECACWGKRQSATRSCA
ncbi:hypothetical protein FIBSPDRAFT_221726 [Athelia psychrophila]|uniref:Uncharacterized protein n=1 Tax=Athelia psychrophila TaxID=1759441 RepID=A0A165Z0A4_9AGAM|nr:hypothetical protein FIBSPDRAFT_221726 [Fibularhizoctonia sp. CBS 109695]